MRPYPEKEPIDAQWEVKLRDGEHFVRERAFDRDWVEYGPLATDAVGVFLEAREAAVRRETYPDKIPSEINLQ